MKRLICTAVLLAAATATVSVHADEIRACSFAVKARCASGDARVTLADGTVKRIDVNVFWCGLPGRPGYTCTIDSTRGEPDSKWSDDGSATLISNTSPWSAAQPDRIKVTVNRDVHLDFKQTQSLGRCGTGAELPVTLVIPAQKGACRVQLTPP
jgi:hypothetical protein